MSSYRIRPGDTLSAIAARNHTTVSALMRANHQIQNPNLIYAGAMMTIPGAADSFEPARSTTHAKPPVRSAPTGGAAGPVGGSSAAYANATQVLGQNISSLKYSGPLAQYLDKWPGNNVCCANFVSACLEKAGQISHREHNDSVRGLASNLSNDPRWARTSLANAKPGDVVCFTVPGEGHYAHVVMFAGWKNGQPQFIGSNNVNADGSQRITQGHMGYGIDAIYHFHG